MAKITIPSSGNSFDSSQVDNERSDFHEQGASKGQSRGWEEPPEALRYETDTLDLVFVDVMFGEKISTSMNPITGPDARSVYEQLRVVGVDVRPHSVPE